jgi:hypothetical protein
LFLAIWRSGPYTFPTIEVQPKEVVVARTKAVVLQVSVLLALAAATVTAQAAPLDLNGGQWEITTTATVAGMGTMPPQTHKACLTANEPVPKPERNAQQCKIKHKIDGNTVSWEISCADPDNGTKGSGNGTIEYSGDSFTGKTSMSFEMPGRDPMKMDATMTGKRIGPCPD